MGGSFNEISVLITADPKQAKESLEGFRSNVEAILQAMQGNFTQFGGIVEKILTSNFAPVGVAAGALGTLGVAMFEVASHAAEMGSKILEASDRTGISTEKLSGLMALTKETGGSFDGLSIALGRAGVALEKAIQNPGAKSSAVLAGVMKGADNLSKLGLLPLEDRLQVVLQHIFALNDQGERNQALSALMGRGWQANLADLKILAEQGFGPLIELAKQFGLFFTGQSAVDMRVFQLETNLLRMQFEQLALALGRAVIPNLLEAIELLRNWRLVITAVGFGLSSIDLRIQSFAARMLLDFPGANRLLQESRNQANLSDTAFAFLGQTMEKNAASLRKLAEGGKRGSDTLDILGKSAKEVTDHLAELRDKQLDAATALEVSDGARRSALKTYDEEIRAIDKAIAEARKDAEDKKKNIVDLVKMEQEANQAKLLALANFHERIRQANEKEVEEAKKKGDELAKTASELNILLEKSFKPPAASALTLGEDVDQLKSRLTMAGTQIERFSIVLGMSDAELKKTAGSMSQAEATAKAYHTILNVMPGVLATIQRAYPGITLEQIRNNAELMKLIGTMQRAGLTMRNPLQLEIERTEKRLHVLKRLMPEMSEAFREAFVGMSETHQKFAEAFIVGESKIIGSINQSLLAYGFSQQAMQQIYSSMLRDLGQMLAKEAHLHALKQIAHALSDLAIGNYAGAAKHFAAAAGWEALGAGVSGLAGTLAGGGAGSVGPRGTSTASTTTATTGGLPPRPPTMAAGTIGPSGNVMVHIMGESQHAQYIAKVLNKAVETQDTRLISTRTRQPSYAGR